MRKGIPSNSSLWEYPILIKNISNDVFYSEFVGETLRIAALTLHFSYFVPKARELISRILRQGDKFMNKNPKDFYKYDTNANYLIRQILSK